MKIDVQMFSDKYQVRKLTEADIDTVYALCKDNTLYYKYCPPMTDRMSIKEDLTVFPKGKTLSDKYYVGFFDHDKLVAIMDMITGYPSLSTAYIGFFMIDKRYQGQGIGTQIISDVCCTLKQLSFESVKLAWVKGNHRSERFWVKNGFHQLKETTSTVAPLVILAERKLKN